MRLFVKSVGLLVCCVASATALDAQAVLPSQAANTALPSYAVTSVKEEVNGDIRRPVSVDQTGDGLYIRNEMLELLIREAYGVKSYQIIGAPAWVNQREWEVDAKTDDAEAQKLRTMNKAEAQTERGLLLQSLLADRFKLVVHHETRIDPGFALVVARGGSKLKEPPPNAPGQPMKPPIIMDNGILTFNGYPIAPLAGFLSQVMGAPVVDKTGLTGKYGFTIPWTESEFEVTADNAGGNGDAATSIFTVLQEQLGLRLESEKLPTDVIVIDHVEEPSPN